ncbi:MAG: 30S ribosomal protein S14 [Cytophagales bacterium]|uniref:30S ribosomal protein S14 n=1 Tax=Nitrosomonas sp. TaxID=42353 RepID=UPI0025D844B0|nr:30S ribosomal protein S14 [Nitrosomonas sp.]MBE7526495.1 30S ribosomal protein S14 [Burkholderiales bacterium]MCC6833671.1 30S ribosomal protein S14 [Cytophagales bacterium]
MAKKSIINRNKKRQKIVNKFLDRRKELIAILKNVNIDLDAKELARNSLQKLPKDSSQVRLRNRCALTGRPRGVFQKFGLGRIKLREIAMRGEIPGLVKASW